MAANRTAEKTVPEGAADTSNDEAESEGPHIENQDETSSQILKLYHTKQRLDNEIMQHQAALLVLEGRSLFKPATEKFQTQTRSLKDKHDKDKGRGAEKDDPEVIVERISHLQDELKQVSRDSELRELLIHRLQLSDNLVKSLFPTQKQKPAEEGGGDQPDYTARQRQCLLKFVERQTELVSQVLSQFKEMTLELQPSLEDLKEKNMNLKLSNREMMSELQTLRESQEDAVKTTCNTDRVLAAQEKVQKSVTLAEVTRQIFQGIVLGSGVNWGADPVLRERLLELGQPLDVQFR